MITREQILSADDRRYDTVTVPQWGGEVRLASMTAAERLEFERRMAAGDTANGNADAVRQEAMVFLLIHSIVDERGNRIFHDADIDVLGSKNPRILLDLFKKAAELNAVTSDAAEEIKGN